MSDKTKNFARVLTPLTERKSAGEQLFDHLKQAIVGGDITPGSRMVESRIAETMGVSRTPVREAIHKLEREGFLVKEQRRGFTVAGLTREDVEETFGIRAVLEGYAARLATINHSPAELKPLYGKIERFETRLEKNDLAALPGINTELHDMLYALSRSPKLIKMIGDLQSQILRFRILILRNRTLARASHQDHMEMLAMMEKRKADEVEQRVRAHILKGQTAVLSLYDQNKIS